MARFNDRYCCPPPSDDGCEPSRPSVNRGVTRNLELPLYDRYDDADLTKQYNCSMRILDDAVVQRNHTSFGHGDPDVNPYLLDSNIGDFYVDVDTGQVYELDYAGR